MENNLKNTKLTEERFAEYYEKYFLDDFERYFKVRKGQPIILDQWYVLCDDEYNRLSGYPATHPDVKLPAAMAAAMDNSNLRNNDNERVREHIEDYMFGSIFCFIDNFEFAVGCFYKDLYSTFIANWQYPSVEFEDDCHGIYRKDRSKDATDSYIDCNRIRKRELLDIYPYGGRFNRALYCADVYPENDNEKAVFLSISKIAFPYLRKTFLHDLDVLKDLCDDFDVKKQNVEFEIDKFTLEVFRACTKQSCMTDLKVTTREVIDYYENKFFKHLNKYFNVESSPGLNYIPYLDCGLNHLDYGRRLLNYKINNRLSFKTNNRLIDSHPGDNAKENLMFSAIFLYMILADVSIGMVCKAAEDEFFKISNWPFTNTYNINTKSLLYKHDPLGLLEEAALFPEEHEIALYMNVLSVVFPFMKAEFSKLLKKVNKSTKVDKNGNEKPIFKGGIPLSRIRRKVDNMCIDKFNLISERIKPAVLNLN